MPDARAIAVSDDDLSDAWEVPSGLDLAVVAEVARDRLEPPDLRGHVAPAAGGAITLIVVEGSPTYDPDTVVYVDGRGAYTVARRQVWAGDAGPRVLLTLRPWDPRA